MANNATPKGDAPAPFLRPAAGVLPRYPRRGGEMDTALIVIIVAAAVLLLILLLVPAMRRRSERARRRKASELREEASTRRERARRAELEAEREREVAESRRAQAERIDPDTGGGFRRRSRRDRNEEYEDRGGRKPGFWGRLVRR